MKGISTMSPRKYTCPPDPWKRVQSLLKDLTE